MFIDEPPSFDAVMDRLAEAEDKLNASGGDSG
jgi:hypothetical protein